MTKETTKSAISAVEKLENSGKRLSQVVEELEKLSIHISSLENRINETGEMLTTTDSTFNNLASETQKLKDGMSTELRLRIAESSAEQSSRIKDANESLVKLDDLMRTHVEKRKHVDAELKNEIIAVQNRLSENIAQLKTSNRMNLFLIIILIILVSTILAKMFDFIQL